MELGSGSRLLRFCWRFRSIVTSTGSSTAKNFSSLFEWFDSFSRLIECLTGIQWTSGWELVAPERNIVFHYYGDSEKRASVFERSHDAEPALKRVRYITGVSDEFPNVSSVGQTQLRSSAPRV